MVAERTICESERIMGVPGGDMYVNRIGRGALKEIAERDERRSLRWREGLLRAIELQAQRISAVAKQLLASRGGQLCHWQCDQFMECCDQPLNHLSRSVAFYVPVPPPTRT